MKTALMILIMSCVSFLQAGTSGGVSGNVFDKETHEALPGATVTVEGTKFGASTDREGHFEVIDIPVGNYTITISLIGYANVIIKDFEIVADSVKSLNIGMVSKAIDMGDVIVEAEAPKIERSTTASRMRISEKDIEASDVSGLTRSGETPTSSVRGSRADDYKFDGASHPGRPSASGLKAGYADDNKQYNYFVNFLDKYAGDANHYPIDIGERICFKLTDKNGKSLPNADIEVYADKQVIASGKTYADGSFFFFPSMYKNKAAGYTVKYSYNKHDGQKKISRQGRRSYDISMQLDRGKFSEAAVDILFILDTTGSMSEEINKLKRTLEIIHLNLTAVDPAVEVRFGMVLYRDRGDDYDTLTIPLTSDVDSFLTELNKVRADGGGDGPEDLQAALDASIHSISWNPVAIHLGFIITDAPPHLDYQQVYNYIEAARDAKAQGIKLFSVGTGGLDISGEYVLRQISQLTYAKYIFLTYGERGESDGGAIGSVSHHTGDNYTTDKLEAIIIQFAREELSHLIDLPREVEEEYFEATKIESEKSNETLGKLFTDALSQLTDYSSIKLPDSTVMGVMPITVNDPSSISASEYFTQNLLLTAGHHGAFKLADRTALDKIGEEWKLQLSGAVNDKMTAQIGELSGAQVLLVGNLFDKSDNYELFLKLVRVATGELLAATKLKIDHRLGLS